MIAYYFPPLGGIGSIRAAKFAKYLPEWGWNPTIIAPSNAPHPQDVSLEHDENSVVRARSFELSRFGKRLVRTAGSRSERGATGFFGGSLRRLAHRFLYYPDAQIGWYPFALRAGRRAMHETRFDALFSSSFPITSHLVARRLHRETGVPWVAEFRDPWADIVSDGAGHDRRERLERSLVREADSVVTVSPVWNARFLEKGAKRAAIVTNGFDPADLAAPDAVDGFVVTHLGSLYPNMQDLRALWAALRQMRIREPGLRMRLRFVGELAPSVREEITAAGLEETLEVTGFLPQKDALAATASSSVLVMGGFHQDDSLYRGWLPAKVFEYLATGLPIVYVGAKDTDATALLSAHRGCYVAATGDVEGVLSALLAAKSAGRVARQLEAFTRRALAGGLARVLEEVHRS
jgi:glycosyltransferase involved in cell wall biosynthesis